MIQNAAGARNTVIRFGRAVLAASSFKITRIPCSRGHKARNRVFLFGGRGGVCCKGTLCKLLRSEKNDTRVPKPCTLLQTNTEADRGPM